MQQQTQNFKNQQMIIMSQQQATIDICIHLHSIRNIGQNYLNKYYFTLLVNAAHHLAVPYQIIPQSQQSISSISLLEYISPLFSLPPFSSYTYQQLIIFKILVPLSLLETQGLEVDFLLHQLSGTQDRQLQKAKLEYTSILGVNSFMPVYFHQTRCAIDAIITTQLLTCRFKNIINTPKSLIYIAIEGLLISYNRLREKVGKSKNAYELDLESFPQLEDVSKLRKIRIFQQSQEKQRIRLSDFEKKIPKISFCVQKLWSQYLALDQQVNLQKYRNIFIQSYALQIKQNVFLKQNINKTIYTVDGLKIFSYPISIKTVFKKQVESFQRGQQGNEHLIILVHGYGATSKTLQQLQYALRFFYPHLHIATSKINQNKTDDDLEELGRRLSLQVQSLINSFKVDNNFNLSFIGHSMGGLIIRSALPFLQKYKYNMKLYISLGSPHLGYFYHNSKITKFGMWAYNLMRKSPSMSTLMMHSESGNHRSTYLYELSTSLALDWFQQVILYAGIDDYFVSEQSALMLTNQAIDRDCERGVEQAIVWTEMKDNFEKNIQNAGISKYLVNFQKENLMNEGSMADELFGRRNHINLAISNSFIAALMLNHSHLL